MCKCIRCLCSCSGILSRSNFKLLCLSKLLGLKLRGRRAVDSNDKSLDNSGLLIDEIKGLDFGVFDVTKNSCIYLTSF